MKVDVFLDTNILIYAASGDASDAIKRTKARAILRTERFGISTQVLQEFYVVAVRKAELTMTPSAEQSWLAGLDGCPCIAVDRDIVKLAIAASIRFKVSYWDAATLAAAEAMGAAVVYSDDLNNGQSYGTVSVINPFG